MEQNNLTRGNLKIEPTEDIAEKNSDLDSDNKKSQTIEELKANRLTAIIDELKKEIENLTDEEKNEIFFDYKGKGENSIPSRAEKILLERFPEYDGLTNEQRKEKAIAELKKVIAERQSIRKYVRGAENLGGYEEQSLIKKYLDQGVLTSEDVSLAYASNGEKELGVIIEEQEEKNKIFDKEEMNSISQSVAFNPESKTHLENTGEHISDSEKNIERDMHDIEVEVREYSRTFDARMKALQEKGLSFEEAAKLMYEEWIKNDPGGQNYIRILNLYKDQIEPDEEIKKENGLSDDGYVTPWETRVRQKMQELEDNETRLKAKIDSTTESIDKINQRLGIAKIKPSEIPSLKKTSEKFGFNKIFKSVLVAGLMLGATSEGLSQTNQDNYKNIDNKEVVTNSEKYLLKLKEFNIVSQEMSSKEFQEIAKDKEKMKKINDEYTKASGIISVHSEEYKKLQEKKPETIKVTVYHIDESQEKKFANKEYTQKDRKEDIENIWEKVKKGELQYGDIVVLRNGERYEIKDYKPGSFNKAKGSILEEGEKVVTTNNTLPMEDYVGRD